MSQYAVLKYHKIFIYYLLITDRLKAVREDVTLILIQYLNLNSILQIFKRSLEPLTNKWVCIQIKK